MIPVIARIAIGLVAIPAAVLYLGNTAVASLSAPAPILPRPALDAPLAASPGEEVAVLAGGCFWGIEAVYEHTKGVKSATSGYAGGSTVSPSYNDVSSGSTGHAEVVRVVYDPSKITYGQILRIFFSVAHDPTQLNRQGPDVGTQYRSAIYYTNEPQKRIASAYIAQLTGGRLFSKPIVTEVSRLKRFYVAEDYHQEYAAKHPRDPYIMIHDAPKVANLKKGFSELYRDR
ncbi:MAG TPA: peptide-methionine (S)-S-oxide reductase MsrA [Gemmatimonadaceae bacterium]|nr:peptide-methionine (S)-S-oxide reductase MsrA [Gemmatimonadaceae bacterium]